MELLGTLVIGLLAVLYALVAVFFFYMTCQERSRNRSQNGPGNLLLTISAHLLCIAWPLAFLATLVSVRARSA